VIDVPPMTHILTAIDDVLFVKVFLQQIGLPRNQVEKEVM
jgi:hypothetical protein